MKSWIVCLALIWTLAVQDAHAAPFSLVNMGAEFREYVDQARHLSEEERWATWKSFESKHASYFNAAVCDSTRPECEEKKRSALPKYFALLPQFESRMWALFQNAESVASAQVTKFRVLFPDLREDVPIVFMPSLFAFNGRVAPLFEKSALFVGVDFVSYREDEIDTLFSHEFFHVHHVDQLQGRPFFKTLASPLWLEGFATWISIQLNPGITDAQALMDPDLADFCSSKEFVQALATEYLSILDLGVESENADESYRNWFTLAGKSVPFRRGYCLGLQVTREMAKERPASALVVLDETEFSPLIRQALIRLSGMNPTHLDRTSSER